MIRTEDFTRASLSISPVWAWDDSGDFLVPVVPENPLRSELGPFIIQARFTASDGASLEGAINDPPGNYSITLFIGDEIILLNINIRELVSKQMTRLSRLLETDAYKLFPLRYETDFHFPGEPNIAGVFDIDVERT